MTIIHSILPIMTALLIGYLVGKVINQRIANLLIRSINLLVYILLFLIGFEFGQVILSGSEALYAVYNALVFATLTSFCVGLAIYLAFARKQSKPDRKTFRFYSIWPPLRDCLLAFAMVLMGGGLFYVRNKFNLTYLELPNSNNFLLFLILLVGVDLAQVAFTRKTFTLKMFSIPLLVVFASFIGAIMAAFIMDQPIFTALALGSGFGWFTLSGVMVGDKLGQAFGSIALLTDLFRELIAIILLYTIGKQAQNVSIGVAGATALDSTLPIIRQACAKEAISLAIVSGFILTVLSPILISLFLSYA